MAGYLGPSNSMRHNYDKHGVSGYYEIVSETYRNPHYEGLRKVLSEWLDRYVKHEKPKSLHFLDMAAGSGEVTESILRWHKERFTLFKAAHGAATSSSMKAAKPPAELKSGTVGFRPPMKRPVGSKPKGFDCQSINSVENKCFPRISIAAADPFTGPAYKARTGLDCLTLSFADVAAGNLPPPIQPQPTEDKVTSCLSGAGGTNIMLGEQYSDPALENDANSPKAEEHKRESDDQDCLYDIVVVSFALHLISTPSELWGFLFELSKRAEWLIVIAPHKKPEIKPTWGWRRWDSSDFWCAAEGRGAQIGGIDGDGFEIVIDRVRLRAWRSDSEIH